MSLELILGLVGGALVALFGGVGWSQIKRHGAETNRREQAEGDRDEAIDIAARRSKAGLDERAARANARAELRRRLQDDS